MSRIIGNGSGRFSVTFGLDMIPSRIGLPGNSGSSSSFESYTVTFLADGLASGDQFCVNIGQPGGCSTNSSSIKFTTVPNGTYSYTVSLAPGTSGYKISPSSGSFTVNGANVTVDITFTPIVTTFYVEFTESGLSGQSWTVTLNGSSQSTTGTRIKFTGLSNGTYPYTVTAPSGYTASPASGDITVNGANVIENIAFTVTVVPLIYVINNGSLQSIDTSTMSVYKTATESTSLGALGFDGTYIYAADGSNIYKYTQALGLESSASISFSGAPVIMSYDGTNLLIGDILGVVYLVGTDLAVITSNNLASDESVSMGTYQGITYTGTYWFVAMAGGTTLSASYIFLLDPSSLAIAASVALAT